MGKLPDFTSSVIARISALPPLVDATEASLPLDQLTVSCYKVAYEPGTKLGIFLMRVV